MIIIKKVTIANEKLEILDLHRYSHLLRKRYFLVTQIFKDTISPLVHTPDNEDYFQILHFMLISQTTLLY